MLLLHGYTEFWWGWRYQLQALTDAGYRAVAVDLRGYGDSDKPPAATTAGPSPATPTVWSAHSGTAPPPSSGTPTADSCAGRRPRCIRGSSTGSRCRLAASAGVAPRRAAPSAAAFGVPVRFLHNQLPRLGERQLVHHDARFVDQYFRRLSSPRWQQTADFADTVTRNRAAMQIPYVAHSSLEYRRWAYRSQFRPDGAKFMKLMNRRLTVPVRCAAPTTHTSSNAHSPARTGTPLVSSTS